MTKADARSVAFQVTLLRTSPHYQETVRKLHKASMKPDALAMMAADKRSDEYADVRLVVGTWDRIAILMKDLTANERHKVFRCTPVHLMWRLLDAAIERIRQDGADHQSNTATPNFAKEFEDLVSQYQAWAQTPAGREFRTVETQAICALFG